VLKSLFFQIRLSGGSPSFADWLCNNTSIHSGSFAPPWITDPAEILRCRLIMLLLLSNQVSWASFFPSHPFELALISGNLDGRSDLAPLLLAPLFTYTSTGASFPCVPLRWGSSLLQHKILLLPCVFFFFESLIQRLFLTFLWPADSPYKPHDPSAISHHRGPSCTCPSPSPIVRARGENPLSWARRCSRHISFLELIRPSFANPLLKEWQSL